MVGAESQIPSHKLVARANMLLPGLYAWVTTVAFPAAQRSAPASARVTAMAALIALVAGPVVVFERPRLGRALGVLLFVALSVTTWLLLGSVIGVQHLEPVRASLGALGWALFAFGWGAVRRAGSIPEEDPHVIRGEPLPARGQLPWSALWVYSIGLVGAVVVLLLAWQVARPAQALLAHAVAVVAAIALVGVAARVAVERGRARTFPAPQPRLNAAARPLATALLLMALGFVWLMLR
jgi:hypothetical protein